LSIAILLLAGALAVSACAAPASDGPAAPADLVGTSWRAETIAGRPALAEASSTLSFLADGRIAGSGGCNRFAGQMAGKDGRLQVGQLASTMMACAPDRMEQEQRFLAALEGAERLSRDGDVLVLEGPAGSPPTRLVRDPAAG
jgi:heat shock protein HslJ